MAKLADALHSGCSGGYLRAGSSPVSGTTANRSVYRKDLYFIPVKQIFFIIILYFLHIFNFTKQ